MRASGKAFRVDGSIDDNREGDGEGVQEADTSPVPGSSSLRPFHGHGTRVGRGLPRRASDGDQLAGLAAGAAASAEVVSLLSAEDAVHLNVTQGLHMTSKGEREREGHRHLDRDGGAHEVHEAEAGGHVKHLDGDGDGDGDADADLDGAGDALSFGYNNGGGKSLDEEVAEGGGEGDDGDDVARRKRERREKRRRESRRRRRRSGDAALPWILALAGEGRASMGSGDTREVVFTFRNHAEFITPGAPVLLREGAMRGIGRITRVFGHGSS